MKFYNIRAVFCNRGSASGCCGFRRNRQKLPGRNSQPQFCAVVAI